jgi:hypothetical protein
MNHRLPPTLQSLLFLSLCMGPACSSVQGDGADDPVVIDDQALLREALTYRDSQAFTPLNNPAYASALGGEAFINVYVSAFAFDTYAAVDPDGPGTGITLPEGTIIVREVLDPSGKVKRLTLMAKGPAGYNPDLGDYWFAVTEPDGTPVVENGATRAGKLADCYSCHLARASDDFLFGVPAGVRQGPGDPPEDPGTPDPGTPDPGTPPDDSGQQPPPPPELVCGDLVCEPEESIESCHWDCDRDDDHDDHDDDDDDDDHD